MDYKCTTHNITVTEEDKKRTFQTGPESIRGLPACRLLTMVPVTEGKHGDCVIEKEEGGGVDYL